MTTIPWLTILGLVPLVGALVLLVLPRDNVRLIKQAALVFSLAALVVWLLTMTLIARQALAGRSIDEVAAETPGPAA